MEVLFPAILVAFESLVKTLHNKRTHMSGPCTPVTCKCAGCGLFRISELSEYVEFVNTMIFVKCAVSVECSY